MKTFDQWYETQAHTGHIGSGGIQAHSAGPLFPIMIRLIGDFQNISCQAFDGSTGKEGPRYPFVPGDSQSFYAAHAKATADARTMLTSIHAGQA